MCSMYVQYVCAVCTFVDTICNLKRYCIQLQYKVGIISNFSYKARLRIGFILFNVFSYMEQAQENTWFIFCNNCDYFSWFNHNIKQKTPKVRLRTAKIFLIKMNFFVRGFSQLRLNKNRKLFLIQFNLKENRNKPHQKIIFLSNLEQKSIRILFFLTTTNSANSVTAIYECGRTSWISWNWFSNGLVLEPFVNVQKHILNICRFQKTCFKLM